MPSHGRGAPRDRETAGGDRRRPRPSGARPARRAGLQQGRARGRPGPARRRASTRCPPPNAPTRARSTPCAGQRVAGREDPGRPSALDRPADGLGGRLLWPVSAPVTSPFGWRWGRMHEGVDLGAPYGAPIAAAAAGTVIYAGWLGGYGNLTVIDHGGGLATAYGHQSRIAVSVGQSVAQGEIIGVRRLDRPLDRPAPPLRGARQRAGRRPTGISLA